MVISEGSRPYQSTPFRDSLGRTNTPFSSAEISAFLETPRPHHVRIHLVVGGDGLLVNEDMILAAYRNQQATDWITKILIARKGDVPVVSSSGLRNSSKERETAKAPYAVRFLSLSPDWPDFYVGPEYQLTLGASSESVKQLHVASINPITTFPISRDTDYKKFLQSLQRQ